MCLGITGTSGGGGTNSKGTTPPISMVTNTTTTPTTLTATTTTPDQIAEDPFGSAPFSLPASLRDRASVIKKTGGNA